MVFMHLLVEVKTLVLLISIGVKKCGINIKKHDSVGWDARASLSKMAVMTGSLVNSSA
jgi:hypothetical protein